MSLGDALKLKERIASFEAETAASTAKPAADAPGLLTDKA